MSDLEPVQTDYIVSRFRRDVILAQCVRWVFFGAFVVCVIWLMRAPADLQKWGMVGVAVLVLSWVLLAGRSIRHARSAGAGTALLAAGRLEEAQRKLLEDLGGFTLFPAMKMAAGHHLAVIAHTQKRFADAANICRAILAVGSKALGPLKNASRLLLADSLLMLDDTFGAYDAFRPVYDEQLELHDRLLLLPIELRYELASGHTSWSVKDISSRMTLAELMDSDRAALVHVLLGEACRRQDMHPQSEYLLKRAALYADLTALADKYPVLNSIAAGQRPVESAEDH